MKISILGTGLMGAALGEGLMQAGYEITAYNRTASKTEALVALGAKAVATPAEAIEIADAVILVVADESGVRDLLLNDAIRPFLSGKKILNASTTNPEEIVKIAREVEEAGGSLAEMSIMIGAEELRDRKGQFLLGCKASDEVFWKEILLSIGDSTHRVGEMGDASKAEAPMLLSSMFLSVATAYAAAFVTKLNVPKEISERGIQMAIPGSEYILPNMFARDYSQCMASVDAFTSVSNTAINSAKSLGVPTKILEDMLALYAAAAKRGFGEQDGSAIMEVLLNPNVDEF
ncbi:NAD(P)-binding domain-containing protein [uncultured Anaeromusa sp.]|uniref:NAD(P)-dependent oxidoreductase n=1 Tax=uncultured Anaeromusa sp. TaxID=673273 RepID=UPI0029C89477|nr:NAD(P)-binding domain-containing protein [uncultured Anaeromusa sp.]